MDETTGWSGEDSHAGEDLTKQVRTRLSEAGADLQRYEGQLRQLVKERPLVAFAGAVLTGYLVGRILSRR